GGVALAAQYRGSRKQDALFWRCGPRRASRSGVAKTRARLPRGGDVLVAPERLVIGHRLAPARHHRIRIDCVGFTKCFVRLLVLEIVQSRQSVSYQDICALIASSLACPDPGDQ